MTDFVSTWNEESFLTTPVAPLGLIAMRGTEDMGDKVNKWLLKWRKYTEETLPGDMSTTPGMGREDFLVRATCPRFGNGEGKGLIKDSDVQNSIIATGGSVVYGAEAMAHLKSIGTVVYLRLTCENITERLGDLHARGVTIKPGWTLRDLYNERCPLYEQYADIVQDCDGLRLRDVVAELQKKLKG